MKEVRTKGLLMQVRSATEADVPEILNIYNEVIANTTAVYAERPVTLDDRFDWFRGRQRQNYPVLVATDESGVIGFASFGDFGAAPCYRFTVEHTVRAHCHRQRRPS